MKPVLISALLLLAQLSYAEKCNLEPMEACGLDENLNQVCTTESVYTCREEEDSEDVSRSSMRGECDNPKQECRSEYINGRRVEACQYICE